MVWLSCNHQKLCVHLSQASQNIATVCVNCSLFTSRFPFGDFRYLRMEVSPHLWEYSPLQINLQNLDVFSKSYSEVESGGNFMMATAVARVVILHCKSSNTSEHAIITFCFSLQHIARFVFPFDTIQHHILPLPLHLVQPQIGSFWCLPQALELKLLSPCKLTNQTCQNN